MNKVKVGFLACVISLCLLTSTYGDGKVTEETVLDNLQAVSCNIHAGRSQGSGVLQTVGDQTWVLTAGHVISHLKHYSLGYDSAGRAKKVAEFDDAEVVQEFVENGRTVGEVRYAAEVIRYSNAESGEDLAFLRIRKKNVTKEKVKFYLDDKVPKAGTSLIHIGSLLGQSGYNSVTTGVLSSVGRVYNRTVYDQTSCTAFPGSSGGGVFFKDTGAYMGMLVRGSGETFNLVVPVRRMAAYAKRTGVYFTMDGSDKAPTDAELKKQPIEEGDGAEQAMPGVAEKFRFMVGTWDR